MKYRIIEHRFSSGEVRFEPQSRFLFWWSGWTEAVNEFQYAPLTFETIYEAEPKGDGVFDFDEREFYLDEARSAIARYYSEVVRV